MINLLTFLLAFSTSKRVFLHMERFNNKFNLIHTGISFSDNRKTVRYDFRPFSTGTYETSDEDRVNANALFPNVYLPKRRDVKQMTIDWGVTNRTWNEIADFESNYLCKKRYILGFYDCRHYTREFTQWSCNNATPIWSLHELW